MTGGWIFLGLILAWAVWIVVRHIRRERRINAAWLESMRRIGRRCPDCRGMGWHFGPPGTGDPAISTPTCAICGGTGEIA